MESELAMGKNTTIKMNNKFKELFKAQKPLIGMIHLPPLHGYPNHPGMKSVLKKASKDLKTLVKAGFQGALVENDNDQPHQINVSAGIIESFTEIMTKLLRETEIPLGMEIIYDMLATVKVACQVKADFVRLDVFVDNVRTKWGKIPAQAEELVALKKKVHYEDLLFLTDIQVKHAKMIDKKTIEQSAEEAVQTKSDGLIVTGSWTGIAPSLHDCRVVKRVAGDLPVLIGSGLNHSNIARLWPVIDGAIVGTSIKTGNLVDYNKAKLLVTIARSFQEK